MNHIAHLRWLAVLLLLGTIGCSGYYWWRLLEGHVDLRQTTMATAKRRALQLADAKAAELDALVMGVDVSLRQFRHGYIDSGEKTAEVIAQSALRTFPDQAVRFFSIIDGKGARVFSVPAADSMDMKDREYFAFHRRNGRDGLLIDKPVMAKRDGAWTVLLSRPILDGQRFAGVAVVGLSVDYLSGRLADLQVGEDDVISVFFSDGAYLARSRDWRGAMGKMLPPERPFLGKDAPPNGVLRVQAIADQQMRTYAWQRLESFPLILMVGLDEEDLLQPVNQAIAQSVRGNAIANAAIGALMIGVVGFMLTNARRQARVADSEILLRSTLNSTYDSIVVTDAEGRVLDANRHFLALMGLAPQLSDQPDGCKGMSFERFYAQLADPEKFRSQRLEQEGQPEKHWDAIELKDGRFLEAYKRIFELNGKTVRLWCFRDVTERRRHELELKELATTDALTGLSNRRSFLARLQEEMERTRRVGGHPTAFLLLDLDHFKSINDTYGHVAGDLVLRNFAALLKNKLRKIDMAGRLGGEEFGILLVDADAQAAQGYAERLCQTVRETVFSQASQVIPVTVSVGLTLISPADAVPDDVLARADEALYRAKDKGRDRVERALAPVSAAQQMPSPSGAA